MLRLASRTALFYSRPVKSHGYVRPFICALIASIAFVVSIFAAETSTNLPTLEVAQATMVTVDLDFGKPVPTVAAALQQIERRSEPDDGQGRTFAILEATGEPTPEGKLHLTMHISSEKAGIASLVNRRTGEILWKNRIVAASHPPSSAFAGKNLILMAGDEHGKLYLLDGSKNPTSIMDTVVRDLAIPLSDFWPDGAERELVVFYSACGCPVKFGGRRAGNKILRISDLPVVFPDDPVIVATLVRLLSRH